MSEASADLAYNGSQGGVLDRVITAYQSKASSWGDKILSYATWLFLALCAINFSWTFGFLAIKKSDLDSFWAELLKFAVFFGFFFWLLSNGTQFAGAIMSSLRQIGENASGHGKLSPSDLVDKGFMIFKMALKQTSVWEPIDSFIGVVLSLIILIILTAITVNMLILYVTQWMLLYAGIFYLGMGGSNWTSDMAISYYRTVLGLGIQLMTMILIVGVGLDLITEFYNTMNTSQPSFEEMGVMLVASAALWMLTERLPPLVAGIATGTNAGGAPSVGAGTVAGAAMAGATIAGAALAAGGAAMMSGATNAAGLADAFKAASSGDGSEGGSGNSTPINNTSSGVKQNGGAALASAMGDSDTGNQGSSSSSKSSSLANTAGRLASGFSQVQQAKAAESKQAFQDQVKETLGGKMAAAIRASDASAQSVNTNIMETPDTENILASSELPSDPDPSEFEEFINRSA